MLPPPSGDKPSQLVSDLKLHDFAKHVDDTNVDFKETILKKVEMIKLRDTSDLQKRVDDVKREEQLACEKLNKEYLKREDREQHIIDKQKKKKQLLFNIIAQWETQRKKRALFGAWKQKLMNRKKDEEQGEYLYAFYQQGLILRALKGFKLYAQVAGNKMYERRVKDRINTEIAVGVENRRNEKEFLVAMIKELEEQLRIELRKKTILKAQCDQAYLRGVSAISMEALKMS